MFINISNHPSELWHESQLREAEKFGEIVDFPFPQVSPFLDEDTLSFMANEIISEIDRIAHHDVNNCVLHIMGEMTLTYVLVSRFSKLGYRCIASTTTRESELYSDGTKLSRFVFVRFRKYNV